jgi:hypothetical protein
MHSLLADFTKVRLRSLQLTVASSTMRICAGVLLLDKRCREWEILRFEANSVAEVVSNAGGLCLAVHLPVKASGAARGKASVKEKKEPSPSVLCKEIWPPKLSTSCLEMKRQSPVPDVADSFPAGTIDGYNGHSKRRSRK